MFNLNRNLEGSLTYQTCGHGAKPKSDISNKTKNKKYFFSDLLSAYFCQKIWEKIKKEFLAFRVDLNLQVPPLNISGEGSQGVIGNWVTRWFAPKGERFFFLAGKWLLRYRRHFTLQFTSFRFILRDYCTFNINYCQL